jgi:hypothetical protein
VGDGHLGESDVLRQFGHPLFMVGVAIAVHEANGAGANAGLEGCYQPGPDPGLVQGANQGAVRVQPLGRFDDPLIEQRGQFDPTGENQ